MVKINRDKARFYWHKHAFLDQSSKRRRKNLRNRSSDNKQKIISDPAIKFCNIRVISITKTVHCRESPRYVRDNVVTCYFQNSLGFDAFTVDSTLLNARGGTTVGSGDEEIKIKVPVGSP